MKRKFKIFLILVSLLIIFLAGLSFYLSKYSFIFTENYIDKKAKIEVLNESVIYYKGSVNELNYNILREEIKGKNFKKIIINSKGGYTISGIKIGNLIFDEKLDVEVEEICFSSCGNYIFTAGKNKIIRKNSVVGWHGSEFQSYFIALLTNSTASKIDRKSLEKSLKEVLKNEKEIQKQIDLSLKQMKTNRKNEKDFFDKIGVDIRVQLYGLKNLLNQEGYQGFTYSLEDMKKFKLNNITYLGNNYLEDYKKNKFFPLLIVSYDKNIDKILPLKTFEIFE